MSQFQLQSTYAPAGDQPQAISALSAGIIRGDQLQTLLGVTGSGKTFTIANVIQQVQMPTLVIAHNKTLAAQLASEFREFFPNNAVHYFVSYYDYYQPEAYMPVTDTYIEKDAQINEEIDRLRHASTQALLTRSDVIIVASVSCIYGLGSPIEYRAMHLVLSAGQAMDRQQLLTRLVAMHYTRTNSDLTPGTFRSMGNTVEIMPVQDRSVIYRTTLAGGRTTSVMEQHAITGVIQRTDGEFFIFPAKHFLTEGEKKEHALRAIESELADHLHTLEQQGKLLEYERIKRRTRYDLAMIREVGYCSGIENYSRHLSGKAPGEAPDTLLSYFPYHPDGTPAFLTVIDESHVTIPQIGGMYAGDQSRKKTLIEHGFRLPSAADNRPLRSEEFWDRVGQTICVSATPASFEREQSTQVVEQIIRPTGLIDPEIAVRPVAPAQSEVGSLKSEEKGSVTIDFGLRTNNYPGQVQDFVVETVAEIAKGNRVLATTLTKQMAEDLSAYLKDLPAQTGKKIKAEYLHSDVETIDRIKILTRLRRGDIDCLVGVNLLREGLDLPEVTLVGILDADKSGFLRSETSLIQTIGRAARNVDGRVILYANILTPALQYAINETNRRRAIQIRYNEQHNITPQSIRKEIRDITDELLSDHQKAVRTELSTDLLAFGGDVTKLIAYKREQMQTAAAELDYETAALIRDEIRELENQEKPKKKPRAKPLLDNKVKGRR